MIVIDEITDEAGCDVVRIHASDFARILVERQEVRSHASKMITAAEARTDAMARDLTAERNRHARAEADADKAIHALRTALRALLDQAERPTIPGLEEAKAEARRTLDEHEEIPF